MSKQQWLPMVDLPENVPVLVRLKKSDRLSKDNNKPQVWIEIGQITAISDFVYQFKHVEEDIYKRVKEARNLRFSSFLDTEATGWMHLPSIDMDTPA